MNTINLTDLLDAFIYRKRCLLQFILFMYLSTVSTSNSSDELECKQILAAINKNECVFTTMPVIILSSNSGNICKQTVLMLYITYTWLTFM